MGDDKNVPDYIKNPTKEYVGNCSGCGKGMTNENQSTNDPNYHKDCDPDNKDD